MKLAEVSSQNDFWSNATILLIEERTSSAIQNAINNSKDWLIIQLLPGEYLISKTIVVSSKVWLKGDPENKSKLTLVPGSNCHILTNSDYEKGNSYLRISNVSFEGNKEYQSRLPNDKRLLTCNAIYLKRVRNAEFLNLEANNLLHTGIHFNACSDLKIEDFSSSNVGWSGISSSKADNLLILGAYVYNSGLDKMHSAIHLDGGTNIHLEARVEKSTGNGIMLDSNYSSLHNAVAKCCASDCKRGLALCGSHNHQLSSVFITGEFTKNKEVGILVSNASGVVITDSCIENNTDYGILLQGSKGAKSCMIFNCRISNSDVPIAEIHQACNNLFSLNVINENKKSAKIVSSSVDLSKSGFPFEETVDIKKTFLESTEHSYNDSCSVCGKSQVFHKNHKFLREGYRCIHCKASLRHRGQAAAIVKCFSKQNSFSIEELCKEQNFKFCSIYEPGIIGSFRSYFKDLPSYKQSYYWEDVEEGEFVDGIQCQNLENLTYEEDKFDLIITSDIMEHVRHPWLAFREIFRILKPGGYHIFTIPVQHPLQARTIYRVDVSGDKDIHLLEPRYHIAGDGSQSLVYTEFGNDIFENLKTIGFDTEDFRIKNKDSEIQKLITFISRKPI